MKIDKYRVTEIHNYVYAICAIVRPLDEKSEPCDLNFATIKMKLREFGSPEYSIAYDPVDSSNFFYEIDVLRAFVVALYDLVPQFADQDFLSKETIIHNFDFEVVVQDMP